MSRAAAVFLAVVLGACLLWYALTPAARTPDALARAVDPWGALSVPPPARADSAAVPIDHGAIVEVRVIYEDGFVQVISSGAGVATATPIPSSTPTASATPAPTLTAPPTNTPRPTLTPTVGFNPTVTPVPFDTPTPETTAIPSPGPTECLMRVKAITTPYLNIRQTPGGTVTGKAYPGDYLKPEGKTTVNGVVWYLVYGTADQSGYVHSGFVEPVAGYDCSSYVFLDGFHTLAGEGASVLLAPSILGKYHLVKCLDNGFGLCQQAKAAVPSLVTVCRSYLYDKIPDWMLTDPNGARIWWDTIQWALPPGCDYYEVQNESDPPLELASAWAQFSIDMAQIIERERGAALLAFSSGPGNPDFPWWRGMWAYVDWAQSHGPAPNGRWHGIATHSSAYAPASVPLPSGSWVNNPYIAGRERIVCDLAAANHYGASCDGLVWINTELGVDDGYSGDKQTFSCEQKALIYKETIRRKQLDGVVDGFAYWNIGKVGAWSDDSACVYQMLN